MNRKDDPTKMAQMHQWLNEACDALGIAHVDYESVEGELLNLIAHVAHGPSRPGAPMTAFLVGLATGRGANPNATIKTLDELALGYEQD